MPHLITVESDHDVTVLMCVQTIGLKSQYYIFCIKVIFYFLNLKEEK
jgi:hypothetical protein